MGWVSSQPVPPLHISISGSGAYNIHFSLSNDAYDAGLQSDGNLSAGSLTLPITLLYHPQDIFLPMITR